MGLVVTKMMITATRTVFNDENSDPDPDLTDNVLGPKDGEEELDETYLLGFAAL